MKSWNKLSLAENAKGKNKGFPGATQGAKTVQNGGPGADVLLADDRAEQHRALPVFLPFSVREKGPQVEEGTCLDGDRLKGGSDCCT